MILVDTSGLIKFFKGVDEHKVHWLEKPILAEEEVCISDYILTEVLQGFERDKDFELARQHLCHFPITSLRNINSYIKAAQIYRKCRQQGVTVPKTADCIIAPTAIENNLFLLHDDGDFDKIAAIVALKIFKKSA